MGIIQKQGGKVKNELANFGEMGLELFWWMKLIFLKKF